MTETENFSQPLLSHKSALATSDNEGNLETLSVQTATTNNIKIKSYNTNSLSCWTSPPPSSRNSYNVQ